MSDATQLPDELNLEMKRGDDALFDLDFGENLTGYTLEATLDISGVPSATALTLTTVDESLGQYTLGMDRLVSIALSTAGYPWSYPWRLKWTDTDGEVMTVLEGVWRIE